MAVTNKTKGPIKMTAQADSATGKYFVTWVRWVGATTGGHTLVVSQSDGSIIFASEADGANFIDMCPVFKICDGIVATTMASGVLYVDYK